MDRIKNPPLGLIPLWLWLELHPQPTTYDKIRRAIALRMAIARYKLAGRTIPGNWTQR